MKLRGLVAAADKNAEVNVSWTRRVWHGGDAKLSKQMDTIRRGSNTDLFELVSAETDEVMV